MAATSSSEFDPETIEPFREQAPFIYDREKRYYGFVSGTGAGKTAAGIARTELNAETWNQGAMGAIIAPTGRMIKNNIIPLMRKFSYLSDWEYKSSHSDEPGLHLHGPEGGRILLLSASDERTIEYLNGLNLAYIWMDEHRDIPERATEIAVQRLRAGDYRNLYATTTPRGKNHTYSFFIGDHTPEKYQWGEATIYETEDRLCVSAVPSHANPFTPQDYKDALEADLPEDVRAQEVRGEFVEIGSGVLSTDMLSYEEPAELEHDWNWKWHVAVDLGIETNPRKARENDTDYWALAVVAEHPWHDHAYLVDLHRRRGQSPDQAAEWITNCIKPWDVRRVKYEAVQAQSWFERHLKDAKLSPVKYNPRNSKEERILGMSTLFSSDKVELIDWSAFDVDIPDKYPDEDRAFPYNNWEPFVNEWLAWPEGSHDDLLDSVAMCLEGVNFGGALEGISGDMYGREEES